MAICDNNTSSVNGPGCMQMTAHPRCWANAAWIIWCAISLSRKPRRRKECVSTLTKNKNLKFQSKPQVKGRMCHGIIDPTPWTLARLLTQKRNYTTTLHSRSLYYYIMYILYLSLFLDLYSGACEKNRKPVQKSFSRRKAKFARSGSKDWEPPAGEGMKPSSLLHLLWRAPQSGLHLLAKKKWLLGEELLLVPTDRCRGFSLFFFLFSFFTHTKEEETEWK